LFFLLALLHYFVVLFGGPTYAVTNCITYIVGAFK
jgi:hypothetical protein